MNEAQINLKTAVLDDGLGLISAAGYINNEGGQAVADAASELVGGGCSSLVIDLDGTRIINSIGVSILLEIMVERCKKHRFPLDIPPRIPPGINRKR